MRNFDRSTQAHNTLVVDGADQNVLSTDPGALFQSGNEAVVSRIEISETGNTRVWASHHGYSRIGIGHQRTVELSQRSMQVLDEVSGAGEHLLDLRYILAPEWRVSSEMMTGETVRCAIAGPRRLALECKAESPLELTIQATQISREYGSGLAASCIRIRTRACLPTKVQTRVQWD